VTAIPFGIYDWWSARQRGERLCRRRQLSTTRVLTADGVVSFIGC